MGGSKKRNKAKAKKLRATVRREGSRSTRQRRKGFLKWGGVIAVLGLLASLPTDISVLKARVVVSSPDNIKTTEFLDVRFRIENESTFSIYDVSPVGVLEANVGGLIFTDNTMRIYPELIHEIEPASKPITFLGVIWKGVGQPSYPTDYADVRVTITFRAAFTWWKSAVHRHFLAKRNPNGEIQWIEVAL
jgi:hypothetical protein